MLPFARRVALLAVQLLMLLLASQASGLVHGVADVVTVLATGADAPDDDDCGDTRGDCQCPAGCPNCHTSHGVGSLPPSTISGDVVVLTDAREVSESPYEALSPPVPELRSIYRPPRSGSRSS